MFPVRMGGIGIFDPTVTAEIEFHISATISKPLVNVIASQETEFSNLNQATIKDNKARMKSSKKIDKNMTSTKYWRK